MIDVYLCYIIEPNAYGKPMKGGRTVLTFVAEGDEERAKSVAGAAAQAWRDETGVETSWHVEPAPFIGVTVDRFAWLREMLREAAS